MELQELEQFGSNIIERTTEIQTKTHGVPGTHPIEFRGKPEKLPVISVRIGFPVYRLKNGRTSTYQLEYLALHPDLPEDFFTKDNDAITAQKAQHEVLGELIDEEKLLKSFKDEEEQVQPLICTNTGVVVNGNRRLCAWRTLYLSDPVRYKNFQNVEIAILPECDEKEIIALEEKLQIQKEKRAEYKWHAKAMMAQQREQNGMKHSDVAKAFDLSSQGLTVLTSAKDYAKRYLESIGKPNQWSLVDKDYYAFEKLVKNIKGFNDNVGDRELFETLVFDMISQGNINGRLYDVIDDVAENLEAIKADLANKYNVDTSTENNSFIDNLAGEHIEKDVGSQVSVIIHEADENAQSKIMKQVQNVIENEKAIKNEIEASTYLIRQVAKASSLLKAAADQGLNEATEIDGVQEQLNSIKKSVKQIEDWLRNE